MKISKKPPILLFFITFLMSSCAVGNITPTVTPQTIASPSATATPYANATPTVAVGLIPIQKNMRNFSDASQWQHTFESTFGEYYRYWENDISPDGHWIVKFGFDKLQLIDVNNPTKPIEYLIVGKGNFYSMKSWAPDGSAFVACVTYREDVYGTCDAMKIFEVSEDGTLNEHDVMWGSANRADSVDVVWSPNNFYVAFYSFSPALWIFNRKGSLVNYNRMEGLSYPYWVSESTTLTEFTTIYSIEKPSDQITYKQLPSTLYEISPLTLDAAEIYKFETAIQLLGFDSQSNYILLEETASDSLTPLSIDLFDLSSRAIIQRYPMPEGSTRINNVAVGGDKIAFDFEDKKSIWVFDFKTKTIEIRKPGMLMGWLPPDKGFLVWDENLNWKLIQP